MAKILKQSFKSSYKYVRGYISYDKKIYQAVIMAWVGPQRDKERDAAKDVDVQLIKLGREPMHVLKRKQ